MTRVGGSVKVTVESCPDLVRGGAVDDDALNRFRDRPQKPGLNNLVGLEPELMIWVRSDRIDAIDTGTGRVAAGGA